MRSINSREGRIKKDCVDARKWGKQKYSETILLLFRARAGSTKDIFFFIRLIGYKGIKLVYNLGLRTHMTIYFEHLEGF
jgi:hypothetical protein